MKKVIVKKSKSPADKKYLQVLLDIKIQIDQSQVNALEAINMALNQRNWLIGKIIAEKQLEHAWGTTFITNLALDIQRLYPGVEGFSKTNVFRMKMFFKAYNFPTAVGKLADLPISRLPWGHNAVILEKVKNADQRLWYAFAALEHGWSRSTLEIFIKKNLYAREGKAITNFSRILPAANSALTQQAFKDPYIFDFLSLSKDHMEYELEQGLIDNVQKLLLEMGKGFALVARQHHLEVGKEDYYIDLLFYHTKLKCYIVVELKSREFDPRDLGQLNFYLSVVDDLVKDKQDNQTVGLLLCKTKNNFTAEYALRGFSSPIGIAQYQTELIKKLPKELQNSLPTIAELEFELEKTEFIAKKGKKTVRKKTVVKKSAKK